MQHQKILILDFGAQYTQLIARRVREAKVYCEIHPCDATDAFVREFGASGLILSGSHMSAYEESTGRAPQAVFQLGVPVSASAMAFRPWRSNSAGRSRPEACAGSVKPRG